MSSKNFAQDDRLIVDLLQSFDNLFGVHAGFRPTHAKGWLCAGTFTPASDAAKLTRAPHVSRPAVPIVVRLSNFTGLPQIPDNDPMAAPRGLAIRFYLAEHVHTDIVAHSENGFPVRTGEEFLELNRAVAASGPNVPHPTPIEQFLGSHPATLKFVTAPKPTPTSFARESFFGVSAFRFKNAQDEVRHGRYRILPELGNEYLTPEEAAQKSPSFLQEELETRIAQGPIKYQIKVQLAESGDEVNDATVAWPESRSVVDFGTITLTSRVNDLEPNYRKIIFDPRPGVDGIDATDDPLFEVRAAVYLLSGRRRRAASS